MRYVVLAAIGIALVIAVGAISDAMAEPRHHRGGWGWGKPQYHHRHYGHRDPSAAFWGGVVGGVLGGLFSGGRDAEPRDEDHAEVAEEIAPWTPAWYDYCRRKYRSFNAETGRYLGYDGELHLCK